MKYLLNLLFLFFCYLSFSQKITYSEILKEDNKNINFEIIGKMNGNILVYKNARSNHNIVIYDNEMKAIEKVKLDFIPDRTSNVDFITYPDFFYIIYQYQKKGIIYCMGAKLNVDAAKINDPVILDTTSIGLFGDNKIYSTVFSEDKQKIMVFKIKSKNELFNVTTVLFDKELKLIKKTNLIDPYNDQRDVYGDFLIDNDANFLFTKGTTVANSDNTSKLQLIIKKPLTDTFDYYDLNLQEKYLDDVHIKADNLNKKYILTSLYSEKKRGDIIGLYASIWDNATSTSLNTTFIKFTDSLRIEAKGDEQKRRAFNNYFVRQIIVKKDGGFLLVAENYATQTRGITPFSRYNYFNRYPYFSAMDYPLYSPFGWSYYRPWNSFNTAQSVRYFYDNIMVVSLSKNASLDWNNVISKEQYDDDNDNYLSFFAMNASTGIHFLFNTDNKNQIVIDQSISASGQIVRNATLKSMERGYEFMPKFSKQVGMKQIIMPCTYRNYICFAKVDFD